MAEKRYVARAAVDGGKLISPLETDEGAVINCGENVTIRFADKSEMKQNDRDFLIFCCFLT